jgi:hypothetical protein
MMTEPHLLLLLTRDAVGHKNVRGACDELSVHAVGKLLLLCVCFLSPKVFAL